MPTVVARYRSLVEAELARGMLEAEGIDVSVLVDSAEVAGVVHTVYEGGARLLARDEDVDRARALLAAVEPTGSNVNPTTMGVWLTALIVLAAVLFLAVRVALN